MKESEEPPLLTPIPIASCSGGYINFNPDALMDNIFNNNYPLVILSVVGDRNSGKSFLLNLLIQYLRSKGIGNWLSDIIQCPHAIEGFEMNAKMEDFDDKIHAWPEMFTYDNGQKMNVVLLDIVHTKEVTSSPLVDLLFLWSSVIIDNQNMAKNLESIAELQKFLLTNTPLWSIAFSPTIKSSPNYLCKNFNIVIQKFPQSSYPFSKSSKKTLKYVKSILAKNCPAMISTFDELEENSVLFLKPHIGTSEKLPKTDMKTFLRTDAKLAAQLKVLCSNIMNSLSVKNIPDGCTTIQYMSGCVDIINKYHVQKPKINEITSLCPILPSLNQNTDQTEVMEEELCPDNDVYMTDLTSKTSTVVVNNPMANEIGLESPGLDGRENKDVIGEANFIQINLQSSLTSPCALEKSKINQEDELYSDIEENRKTNNFVQNYKSGKDNQSLSKESESSHPAFSSQDTQKNLEAISKKADELRSKYKKLNRPCPDSVLEENFNEVAAEFNNFLNKFEHLQATQKEEHIRTFRNSLFVHQKMILKTQKADTLEENAISQLSNQQSDISNSNSLMEHTNTQVCDTCIDDFLDTNNDEKMDTFENIKENTEKVISEYKKNMAEQITKHLSKNMLLSEEDFHKSHLQAVEIVIKDIQFTQEIVESAVVEFRREFWEIVDRQNDAKNQEFEQIINDFLSYIKSNVTTWIDKVTSLNEKSHEGEGEFVDLAINNTNKNRTKLKEPILLLFDPQKSEDFQHCKRMFIILETCFHKYRENMENTFQKFCLLQPSKLLDVHTKQTALLEMYVGKENKFNQYMSLLHMGLDNLFEQYQLRNEAIRQNEIICSKKLHIHVSEFYWKSMQEVTKDKIFMHNELEELSNIVINETLEAFKKSCNYLTGPELVQQNHELSEAFEKQFLTFVTLNRLRLEKITRKVNLLVGKHRKEYNDKMDEYLPSRGPSQDKNELEKKHISIMNVVTKLLTMEISKNTKIDPDQHLNTLKSNILSDWFQIQEKNSKLKIKEDTAKLKEKHDEEVRIKALENESKKQDAKLILYQNSQSKTSKNSENNANSNNTLGLDSLTTLLQQKELPPIAIDFGFSVVRVGYINDNYEFIIKDDIPTCLAVNKNNEILVGLEAIDHSERISIEHTPTSCSITLNGTTFEVRMELLVALFLSKLKKEIEQLLNGNWTTAVISIPLCFTSVQRQAMKNSATMAGFTNTYLINDTTAAALHVASLFRNNLGIISAVYSENHFDAAIYEVKDGKITMLNSCGDLHASFTCSKNLLRSFKNYLRQIPLLNRLVSKDDEEIEQKLIKNLVGNYAGEIIHSVCCNYAKRNNLENYEKNNGNAFRTESQTIIRGASIFAEKLINCSSKENAKKIFKDKATYQFQRITKRTGQKTSFSILFKPYQELQNPQIKDSNTIGPIYSIPETTIQINEVSTSTDNIFKVGTLIVVKPNGLDTKRCKNDFKIRVIVSDEGIFEVEAVVPHYSKTCLCPPKFDFKWNSPNLTMDEIYEYTKLVKSMQKAEKKEAIMKSKKELENLVAAIKGDQEKIKKKSIIRETLITKGISEAQEFMNHPNTTQEMLNKKIDYLTGLKNKYLDKK